MLFCSHHFSPLNTFRRKGKDPEPDPPSDNWIRIREAQNMRILLIWIRFRIRMPNTERKE